MSKKMLITCFEPFNKEKINSSFVVVEALKDKIGDYKLIKLTLPVVYGKAFEIASLKIEKFKPDVVLSIGQAGGRKNVSLEKIAINYRSATIADNAGNIYSGVKIDENGEDGIFVNLDVEKLAKVSGSEISLSAGSFVCNDLTYLLLNHYQDKLKVGFIHVPYLPIQADDNIASMSLEEMVKKLTLIIENL